MQTVHTVLILLLVVGGTRLLANLAPLPLPLIQIVTGGLLAWPNLGLHLGLDPELFMFLFIPPLLFADGWRMPKGEFWKMRWPIMSLACALVLLTVLGGGVFIHFLIPEIPWAAAFALAAVLSPTDALAVSAIAQDRLPRKLMYVLQGEALMNDATGLVTFKFAVAAAVTGTFSLGEASLAFLAVALGGMACGLFLSWLLGRVRVWMIRRGWDDPATHVVLMLLLPFAAYMAAERLEVSGVLAAVAAGMMQSWADLLPRQTNTRLLNRSVWSMLEFTFNGVVFLLLGLQMPSILKSVTLHSGDSLWRYSLLTTYVLAVFAVLLLMRFAWVWCYWKLAVRFERWWGIELGGRPGTPTLRLSAISALSGVRGALTLAAVLSVPLLLGNGESFPQRDLIIFIAAGVILVSLLAATIGLPILLRGLPVASNDQQELELRSVWRRTAVAAIRQLEHEPLPAEDREDAEEAARLAEIRARLMAEYRQQLDPVADSQDARERARGLELADQALRIKALHAQRLELYRLRKENLVDDETMRRVLGDLDVQEAWLTSKAGRWV